MRLANLIAWEKGKANHNNKRAKESTPTTTIIVDSRND
jgi:hypothetical protein